MATPTTITAHVVANGGGAYPSIPYDTTDPVTNTPDCTFTVGVAEGVRWKARNGDVLVARNTSGAATKGVAVTSVVNVHGRTGDIGPHEVPISGFCVLGPLKLEGFVDGNGYIVAKADAGDYASIEFCVLRFQSVS